MRFLFTQGMRFMLLGTFFFSIGSLLIKLAGTRIPTMELLFLRGILGLAFCWVILRRAGVALLGNRKLLLTLRGSVGFMAFFAEFYALIHLPLADATAILFTHPAVVAVAAWAVLGERLGKIGLAAVATSLTGVGLVCRPELLFGGSGAALDPLGVTVALCGVAVTSVAILLVRTLAKTEHPAVVMFYPPLIISCAAPIFASGWVLPMGVEWLYIVGIALSMNAGQYYMTKGYAIESAARISGITCLEIVFAALWSSTFLREIPDVWTMAGGALIVSGTIMLGKDGEQKRTGKRPAPASGD